MENGTELFPLLWVCIYAHSFCKRRKDRMNKEVFLFGVLQKQTLRGSDCMSFLWVMPRGGEGKEAEEEGMIRQVTVMCKINGAKGRRETGLDTHPRLPSGPPQVENRPCAHLSTLPGHRNPRQGNRPPC